MCSYLITIGASTIAADIETSTPVHYAIQNKQLDTFKVLLDTIIQQQTFGKINSEDAEMTLASHCVVNQSWYCLSHLISSITIEVATESKAKVGAFCEKIPQYYAEEAELIQEYDQIVAWFQNEGSQFSESFTLDSVLTQVSQIQNTTLFITDPRCLEHAPILKPQIFSKRFEQRESQPENSDRLHILMNSDDGLFTKSTEFSERQNGLEVKESSNEAYIADILKVHDFNYI